VSAGRFNAPLGAPPTLEWCAVSDLAIDPSYQRSTRVRASQRLIERIAQYWDWGLCQPLAVARREDGSLMVVDGQHRLEAARLRGDLAHLPCVITRFGNAGDEAAAFVALNRQRRPLAKLDLFKAALAAGEAEETAIAAAISDAGLILAPHSNFVSWKPGMVSNIGGIHAAWREKGEHATRIALAALADGFAGAVLRYAGTIFPGIAGFVVQQRMALTGLEFERLVRVLRSRDQVAWRKAIFRVAADTGQRRDVAARTAITAAWDRLMASEAPAASAVTGSENKGPKPPMSFEEQMAKVAAGAGLVEVAPIRAADPAMTLGGVTGEIV
jgi:hypothetical protein